MYAVNWPFQHQPEGTRTMASAYSEAYADPMMQGMYQEEREWGLPFDSFDSFMRHSVIGAGRINDMLKVETNDGPFSWGDDEVHNAASAALLILRSKKNLTDEEFAQLCWLERSLHMQVSYCIAPHFGEAAEARLLSRYAHLINEGQLRLIREDDARVHEDVDDLIRADENGAFDNVVELSPEALKRTGRRIENTIRRVLSAEYKAVQNEKRERVLEYLNRIA